MTDNEKNKPHPPGRVKIVNALRTLLATKDFSSIKIADIATTAGVTEPLIYKYFKDKRDVLYHLLQEYLETTFTTIINQLNEIDGSLNKIKHFILSYINAYDIDRVIARVILLEVSNSYDYYESQSYRMLKKYGKLMYTIIDEGVKSGELRDDVTPTSIRNLLFGSIDRACLSPIIFNKPIDVQKTSSELTTLIFDAIKKN